jgi:putative selenate reductase
VCDKCVEVCPNRANLAYQVAPVRWTLPVLACRDGTLAVIGEELFQVTQAQQIVHLDDFCNECGNCATFCVHRGKPYADKPRLFLVEADFQREEDNAFHITRSSIRRRARGQEAALTLHNGSFLYEDGHVRASLSGDGLVADLELKEAFEGAHSLRGAAELALIFKGIFASAPFLVSH